MMQLMRRFTSLFTALLATLAFLPADAAAGEKKLMHCFAFTEIATATDADWAAFMKATNELPDKIEGLEKVWVGKLRRPLRQYGRNQAEPAERQSGVCMEMADEAALEVYANHPAHSEWVKVYAKVRVAGTTTFDIIGR